MSATNARNPEFDFRQCIFFFCFFVSNLNRLYLLLASVTRWRCRASGAKAVASRLCSKTKLALNFCLCRAHLDAFGKREAHRLHLEGLKGILLADCSQLGSAVTLQACKDVAKQMLYDLHHLHVCKIF